MEPLEVAARVAQRLGEVRNVVAVVLGGSRGRGDADSLSDVDLGLYYDEPLDVDALRRLARELDSSDPPAAITEPGGWGPWINGGGWLSIDGVRVDWLYRDLGVVRAVIDDCVSGRFETHYQPGHPHGFHTHMYMAEVHHARALVDRGGAFAALQARTVPYPPALRAAVIQRIGWEAGFALETAAKSARRGDVFQVSGSLFRCAACLVQTLFALEGRYFMNEKRALEMVGGFAVCPPGLAATVADVLAAPGRTPEALVASLGRMETLVRAVDALCQAT